MPSEEIKRIAWKPIEPLDAGQLGLNGAMAALEALRQEWERYLGTLTSDEQAQVRQRSLRRLAVETGIIERLYDIDWGLTLTLVAEGFTKDVVERAGGRIDDHTLLTLQAQRESLGMVLDFVNEDRRLTPSFIKELHAAMTRTQRTYTATDVLGRTIETELPHGEWKHLPNHVLRKDGTLLEYAPPTQVASEMDRLAELYEDLEKKAVHPLVISAWLHHRFVQIHPFADGNGRVARALTLLILQKHRYAPLVIDRFHRSEYIDALEVANTGDLRPLNRLFVRLESSALASELERLEQPAASGVAVEVAHTLAAQIAAHRQKRESELQQKLRVRGKALGARLGSWLKRKKQELQAVFKDQGTQGVTILTSIELPPSEKTRWFRLQVIESARATGHYANFDTFTGWGSLRVRVENLDLRYVVSIHGAGRDAGVLAVTTFGILGIRSSDKGGRSREIDPSAKPPEAIATTRDAFLLVHSESMEALDNRAQDLEDLLEEGLAVALSRLSQAL